MKAAIRNTLATGVLAAAFAAGPTYAMGHAESVGTALANAGTAVRVITIDPATRWVNVSYGETVKFVVAGGDARSFVFRFDGNTDRASLRDIAPQGANAAEAPIYIDQAANPLHARS